MDVKTVTLWIDFMANQKVLQSEKEQKLIIEKAVSCGVTDIVVDAKIPYGYTTFPSRFSGHVSDFPDGRYEQWAGRDFVKELMMKGLKEGVRLWIKLDVFTEGHIDFPLTQQLAENEDWHVSYLGDRLSGSSQKEEKGSEKTIFVNPAHPKVQNYELNIIEEVVSMYTPFGIILDRARYPNRFSDFSEYSLAQFSACLTCHDQSVSKSGGPIGSFNSSIDSITSFEMGENNSPFGLSHKKMIEQVRGDQILRYDRQINSWIEGPLYHKWLMYRAKVIQNFFKKVRRSIQHISPSTQLALYTGSWYETAHEEGLNWASPTHSWQPVPSVCKQEEYLTTSLIEFVDRIYAGCYYPKIYQSERLTQELSENTVEGSVRRAKELTNHVTELHGGLYLLHYRKDRSKLKDAFEVVGKNADGLMLFDLVYFDEDLWDVVRSYKHRVNEN
ncbi:alpha amylase family protein [Evansella tamaricis]|uniref:Family 10 glycosylhydrolase n=1 Tax=Evansella tamaricis TaxID=2069301 RepID=A0ABS6JH36_9BACI|nr:alpha amylase family protein [Evansella tamaricis]MBU9712710.1 family 10 glycosylhydrolase [Evansella tamaricis]